MSDAATNGTSRCYRAAVIALSDISRCYGCGTRNPIGLHLSQHARRVDDDIVIDVSLGPFFAGYPGITHGGVIATMLDEAIGMHAFGVLGVEAPTAQLNISYRAPVPTETSIQVRGRGTREGRRVHSTAEVTDVAGAVLASAEAVMVVTGEVAEETRLEYLDALGS